MKRNSDFSLEKFSTEKIHAVDAKFEAQKIAFAPLAFQAIRALLDLGIMKAISDSGEDGITVDELVKKTGVSEYGVKVLTEMAVGMHVLLLKNKNKTEYLSLGKIGWFLLEDNLTKVNFNFTNDICYKGAFDLTDSIKFLFTDLFDTIGTLLGVAEQGNLKDKDGNVLNAKGALLADAVGTVAGACLGTSTVTSFVESSSGVAAGGRTGLTSVVTALLFILSLFLSPLFFLIPAAATAPALIFVGYLMMKSVTGINFEDPLQIYLTSFLKTVLQFFREQEHIRLHCKHSVSGFLHSLQ